MEHFYEFFNIQDKQFKMLELQEKIMDVYGDIHYQKHKGVELKEQTIPTTYEVYIGENWGLYKFEASSTISIIDAFAQVLIDNKELHAIVKDVYEL